jgi:hypothetical protein
MEETAELEDYFSANEVDAAKKYVEVYHGRFLLTDKLRRSDAVLLAIYMYCNRQNTAVTGKNDLKRFAVEQLGINSEIFSRGLSDLRLSKMITVTVNNVGLSFKGLKKLREILEVKQTPAAITTSEAEETVPLIGDVKSVRDGILKLLSASIWSGKPKTLAQIMDAFEINALYYPKGTVGTELKRMTKSGLLRRIRLKSGYGYVLAQRAKQSV